MLAELAWLAPAYVLFGAVAGLLLGLAVALAFYGSWMPATGVAAVALLLGLLARSMWRNRKEAPA